MMNIHLITLRRQEIEQEIARLNSRLSEMDGELKDLAIAERVFDRLSGAAGNSSRASNESKPTPFPRANPNAAMSLRDLIIGAVTDAKKNGIVGLKPREIQKRILQVYGVDKAANVVNTRTWRLWNEDKALNKSEGGVYSLPSKEIPADDVTVEGPSAGESETSSEHGREADRGGAS
jgi:hypothetical protein